VKVEQQTHVLLTTETAKKLLKLVDEGISISILRYANVDHVLEESDGSLSNNLPMYSTYYLPSGDYITNKPERLLELI
jgi:hypothetical protein